MVMWLTSEKVALKTRKNVSCAAVNIELLGFYIGCERAQKVL